MAVTITARVALGLFFGLTALGKVANLKWFVQVVKDYNVVPDRMARGSAIAVVALECATASSLLTGIWTAAGALTAAVLLAAFTAAIAVNMTRGRRSIACGCGSPMLSADHIGWHLVARNGGLFGLALVSAGAAPNLGVRKAAAVAAVSVALTVGGLVFGRRKRISAASTSSHFAAGFVRLS